MQCLSVDAESACCDVYECNVCQLMLRVRGVHHGFITQTRSRDCVQNEMQPWPGCHSNPCKGCVRRANKRHKLRRYLFHWRLFIIPGLKWRVGPFIIKKDASKKRGTPISRGLVHFQLHSVCRYGPLSLSGHVRMRAIVLCPANLMNITMVTLHRGTQSLLASN